MAGEQQNSPVRLALTLLAALAPAPAMVRTDPRVLVNPP